MQNFRRPKFWFPAVILAAAVLFLAVAYRACVALPSPALVASPPAAPSGLTKENPAIAAAAHHSAPRKIPTATEALASASGTKLAEALFPVARWQAEDPAALLAAAQARFTKPYAAAPLGHGKGAREEELRSRLVTLKALGSGLRTAAATRWFVSLVGGKQPLVIQRQALENLRPHLAAAPEAERGRLLRIAGPGLVWLAQSSERELLARLAAEKEPALNAEALASVNDWEALPCPTEAEARALAARVAWEMPEPYVCDFEPAGKFVRLLAYVDRLRLSGLGGTMETRLARPLDFIAARSRKLVFDFRQKNSVAFNLIGKNEIHLGSIFFTDPPLDSLETLVHEARHSDLGEDPGHETCVQGDIPLTPGGCDSYLTDGDDAGAYSYGLFFQLGLAASGAVSAGDAEYLRSAALLSALRRFNQLDPRLAHFHDLVAGLDEAGHLRVLHPFAAAALPGLGLPPERAYDRLAYDDRSGGLVAYAGTEAWEWRWGFGARPYGADHPGGPPALLFSGKGFAPGDTYAHNLYLRPDGVLAYVDRDPATGLRAALDFPLRAPFGIQSFFQALGDRMVLLSREGGLWRARRNAIDPDFTAIAPGERVRQATGGVLRDKLFLVNTEGTLRWLKPGDPFGESGSAEPSLEPTALQIPGPLRAYEEGTSLRALLGVDGSLHLAQHGRGDASVAWGGPRLKEIVVFRQLEGHGALALRKLDPKLEAHFRDYCRVDAASVVREPWFGRAAGIRDGNLYFQGEGGACLAAALPEAVRGRVRAFRFASEEKRGTDIHQLRFPPTVLELTLEGGEVRRMLPYGGKL